MTERPHYAIMRIGKIHNKTALDAVEWHNTRQGSARVVEDMGTPDEWVSREGAYRDRADAILAEVGARHEPGKVLAVEVLLSASPEWWNAATNEQKREWWEQQYAYAEHLFGPGLLAFTPHLDESTPHAQLVGLPLYEAVRKKRGRKPKDPVKLRKRLEEEARAPKIWRLSHDAVFGGGPIGLAKRQTEYHGFVAHLGLSRGQDTVGKGKKHIPLKLHAQLLLQEERELIRERRQQAEEQAMLQHYDDQIKARHKKSQALKVEIEDDERRLFAEQESFRVREEALVQQEIALKNREKKVADEERRIQLAKIRIDEEEAKLEARRAEQFSDEKAMEEKRADLNDREALLLQKHSELASRKTALEKRAQDLEAHEARNEKQDRELRTKHRALELLQGQISVLASVLAGRLGVKLDEQQKPRVIRGELDPHLAHVTSKAWPFLLLAPLRHANAMANKRRSLATKVRKIISKMRMRRQLAIAKELEAERRLEDARTRESVAGQAEQSARQIAEQAEATKAAAAAERQEASEKMRAAENVERTAKQRLKEALQAEATTANKRTELAALNSKISEARASLAVANDEAAEARQAAATLQASCGRLRADEARLAAKKEALGAEISDLEKTRADLEKERKHTADGREALQRDRAAWERSMKVWKHAANNGASIDFFEGREVIVLKEYSGRSVHRIPTAEVSSSVVGLVRHRKILVDAMDATERLACELDKRKVDLAERFPLQKASLQAEREKDRTMVKNAWLAMHGSDLVC